MKDKGILASKYKPDRPKVEPSFVELPPDPLIRRAIAVKKLKNRTREYTAIKRRRMGG